MASFPTPRPGEPERRPWLGTSWKMNKTVGEARAFAATVGDWASRTTVDADVSVFPPFTALGAVVDVFRAAPSSSVRLAVGAQNMHWEDDGPFTGEVSPVMIEDVGARTVEIGHFERRTSFGETDATVNRKVKSALKHGLGVVLCVGDSSSVRDFGVVREYVGMQVKVALHDVPASSLGDVVVAYEPGWAIGIGGTSATVEEVASVHAQVRQVVEGLYGADAARLRIVYGGSVTHETVPAYAAAPEVDGLFVGRAAWDAEDFVAIIEEFVDARRAPSGALAQGVRR